MTEWFRQRYIERTEHEQIVAYYTRLVAELYRQVRELRAVGIEIDAIDSIVRHEQHKAEREIRRTMPDGDGGHRQNVIHLDFTRRH